MSTMNEGLRRRFTPAEACGGIVSGISETGAKIEAQKKKVIDQLCERHFGITADAPHSQYTAHPVLAGVVRDALSSAYAQASIAMMSDIMEAAFASKLEKKAAPEPDAAGS